MTFTPGGRQAAWRDWYSYVIIGIMRRVAAALASYDHATFRQPITSTEIHRAKLFGLLRNGGSSVFGHDDETHGYL